MILIVLTFCSILNVSKCETVSEFRPSHFGPKTCLDEVNHTGKLFTKNYKNDYFLSEISAFDIKDNGERRIRCWSHPEKGRL